MLAASIRISSPRALFVDLNNFSRYPTVGVGYIARALRKAGWMVDILSPLAEGVRGVTREPRATLARRILERANQAAAHSSLQLVRRLRGAAASLGQRRFLASCSRVASYVARALDHARYDCVLVSAYLMYFPVCESIGLLCKQHGLPLIIGGAYLNQPEVAEQWRGLRGLTALVGGEPEMYVADLVSAAAQGHALGAFPGVVLPDGRTGPKPTPLHDLDAVPFPDYEGFPWDRYPRAIVPVISGRGCGWSACSFCSDITSSSGRTFRSRSVANVLDEIGWQSQRHGASRFVFTDLKLNSSAEVWNGILHGMPSRVADPRWIAAVHVDAAKDSSLSADTLRAARAAGCVRLTTGLESGSQRVLDAMHKGTDVARNSSFVKDAAAAGISVRVTLVLGYPGEEAHDVARTARFLRDHETSLDRVSINRFRMITGTTIHRQVERHPDSIRGLRIVGHDHRHATLNHAYTPAYSRAYSSAVADVLDAAHRINRRELRHAARDFEGVM